MTESGVRRGPNAPKTRIMQMRFAEEQWEAISEASAKAGVDSRAEFIRQIVNEALGLA